MEIQSIIEKRYPNIKFIHEKTTCIKLGAESVCIERADFASENWSKIEYLLAPLMDKTGYVLYGRSSTTDEIVFQAIEPWELTLLEH